MKPAIPRIDHGRGGDGGNHRRRQGRSSARQTNRSLSRATRPSITSMARRIPTSSTIGANTRDQDGRRFAFPLKWSRPGVVGVTDLDVSGAWRPAPINGNVWFPNGPRSPLGSRTVSATGALSGRGLDLDLTMLPGVMRRSIMGRWVMVGGLWGWAPGPIAVTAILFAGAGSGSSAEWRWSAWLTRSAGSRWAGASPGIRASDVSWGYYNARQPLRQRVRGPASSPVCGVERPSTWGTLTTPAR